MPTQWCCAEERSHNVSAEPWAWEALRTANVPGAAHFSTEPRWHFPETAPPGWSLPGGAPPAAVTEADGLRWKRNFRYRHPRQTCTQDHDTCECGRWRGQRSVLDDSRNCTPGILPQRNGRDDERRRFEGRG